MHSLTKFFYLMQLMRAMPQTGWARLYGSSQPSNLGAHSYLVTIIAWRLARLARGAGAEINVERVMELALLHDVGELMGGDIGMPYATMNPKARQHAKAFEAENLKFFLQFLESDSGAIERQFRELEEKTNDEARIVKIADYLELQLYLQFVDHHSDAEAAVTYSKINETLGQIEDAQVRVSLQDFLTHLFKDFGRFTTYDDVVLRIMQETEPSADRPEKDA